MMNERLSALKYVLLMTDEDDWPLIHATVRNEVNNGEISKEEEQQYSQMVDDMLLEREKGKS